MKFLIYSFFIIYLCILSNSKNIILSAGVGQYTHDQLWKQYTAFKTYSNIGIITASSILAYNLDTNGSLASYDTNDTYWTAETYQQYIKQTLKLKSYPCVYCDSTIGMCSNLSSRLENLYLNVDKFIDDSIQRAKLFNYDGYFVDFEPDTIVNSTKLTDFILMWNEALNKYNLTLNVWIGYDTPYDDRIWNTTTLNLVSMNTYTDTYDYFIYMAGSLQTSINDITRLGFGLLTNYGIESEMYSMNETEIMKIAKWSKISKVNTLSLWASHISPHWYNALYLFIH